MIKEFLYKLRARKATHRILETRGVFIPQVYRTMWQGIEIEKSNNMTLWYSLDVQIDKCAEKTFDKANEILQRYLCYEDQKNHHEKEIIHLVEKDPEIWGILKNKEIK